MCGGSCTYNGTIVIDMYSLVGLHRFGDGCFSPHFLSNLLFES